MPVQILFVTNEPRMERVIRQCFKDKIKANKYQFTFATDGIQAFKEIKSNPESQLAIVDMIPQISILDWLPRDRKLPGVEFLSSFEKHGNNLIKEYYCQNIPILSALNSNYPKIKKILASALVDVELIRMSAIDQGASTLLKPYDSDELEQMIEQSLLLTLG